LFRLPTWLNLLPHSSHVNGFSRVWVRMWSIKFHGLGLLLPHFPWKSQMKANLGLLIVLSASSTTWYLWFFSCSKYFMLCTVRMESTKLAWLSDKSHIQKVFVVFCRFRNFEFECFFGEYFIIFFSKSQACFLGITYFLVVWVSILVCDEKSISLRLTVFLSMVYSHPLFESLLRCSL